MPGKNVAFVGLGVMGYPMAGHLVTKGAHAVTVYNRNPAKAKAYLMRTSMIDSQRAADAVE